jgi:hypothetical protein
VCTNFSLKKTEQLVCLDSLSRFLFLQLERLLFATRKITFCNYFKQNFNTHLKNVAIAFISYIKHKNNAHHVNYTLQHCYVFPKKTYTLAGFEPGFFCPEVDAIPTKPFRHGKTLIHVCTLCVVTVLHMNVPT